MIDHSIVELMIFINHVSKFNKVYVCHVQHFGVYVTTRLL